VANVRFGHAPASQISDPEKQKRLVAQRAT
jgi:hypothetical protein